jgi:acyl carrier protein
MNTDTAERTIAVIAKFREIPEDQITVDTSLEELKMDSLDGLNLIFELEEEFDIMIPDDKALQMKTIGEMVAGIDLIRSGESLEDVSDEEMEMFRDAVKANEAETSENAETSEKVETAEDVKTTEDVVMDENVKTSDDVITSDDVVTSGDVETPEKMETEETAAEGK